MQAAIQLSNWQLAVLVALPTLASITGFLNNNSRISDLKANILHLNGRIGQLIGAFNEVAKRLTVVESRLKIEPQ
jgi:hypothetical protein